MEEHTFRLSASDDVKEPEQRQGGIKTPKKHIILIAAAVAVVAVLAIIIGVVANLFSAKGPATEIASAVKRTLKSENVTVDFMLESQSSYNDYDEIAEATAKIVMDADKRELTVYADVMFEEWDEWYTVTAGTYKGKSFSVEDGDEYVTDESEEIEKFFQFYENIVDGKVATQEFWKDFVDERNGAGSFDEAIERSGLDQKELDAALERIIKKFNDEEWLREYAGYSKTEINGETWHSFYIEDPFSLYLNLVEELEDAFADRSAYLELRTNIKEAAAEMEAEEYAITEISVGIKGGKLTAVKVSAIACYEGDIESASREICFYDYGKTEIDTAKLDKILARAQ